MRQGVFTPKLKLLWHCDKIIDWQKGKNIAPIMVEFDLSNRCQLKCNFCTFRYMKDRSDIDTTVALKAITSMANMGVKSINFTGGGEPTLHKDFDKILGQAYGYGIDVGLFTNGLFKEELIEPIVRKCNWARVSLDAGNKETFTKVKKIDAFDKVIENTRRLVDRRDHYGCDTTIGLGFVISPDNYSDIEEVSELAKDIGVDYLQYKPVIDNMFDNSHTEANWWRDEIEPRLERVMNDNEKAVINLYKFNDLVSNMDRDYDECFGHQFCPCVGADGNVWICTHLREIEGYSMGNLYDTKYSFKGVWNGQKRQDAIKRIDLSKCQKYCRNNEINKVLYQLKYPDKGGHYNFI